MPEYDRSIVDVLKTALNDAQDLIRGEIALARAELRAEARRLAAGAAALVTAAVAALIAVVFLLTAAAWAFVALFDWPAWTGFAIVGFLVAVAAGALAMVGRNRLAAGRHMPLTVDTMKENMEWMRARTS